MKDGKIKGNSLLTLLFATVFTGAVLFGLIWTAVVNNSRHAKMDMFVDFSELDKYKRNDKLVADDVDLTLKNVGTSGPGHIIGGNSKITYTLIVHNHTDKNEDETEQKDLVVTPTQLGHVVSQNWQFTSEILNPDVIKKPLKPGKTIKLKLMVKSSIPLKELGFLVSPGLLENDTSVNDKILLFK